MTLLKVCVNFISNYYLKGFIMGVRKKNQMVYGVGINDADYVTDHRIDGKRVVCPYYNTWKSMLMRCYGKKYQEHYPTYKGCSVCPDWLYFMNFRKWMIRQDWEGKQLDKDLLVRGNKVYSEDTCVFVDAMTNLFTTDRGRSRGNYPLGVCMDKRDGKFQARCCNPFTKKQENLGYFTCEHQAHLAWKDRKHILACQLADLQTDPRVAAALRTRYSPEHPQQLL